MTGHAALVDVGDASLEVEVTGSGEPVVVLQTALTVDELLPLSRLLARSGRFQLFHCHRRGYAGSGPARRPGSVIGDAADAAALIRALDAGPAHVVGASYSAAVGLSLAAAAPDLVHSLTVVEPPPAGTPADADFRAANADLLRSYESLGPGPALDRIMTMLSGSDWREVSERDLPGSVEGMERDASTFFGSDVPALMSWRLGDAEARQVRCPVLYVGGEQSGDWFTRMRARLLHVLPDVRDATVRGAGHMVASTHPAELAGLLLDHFDRHPLPAAR